MVDDMQEKFTSATSCNLQADARGSSPSSRRSFGATGAGTIREDAAYLIDWLLVARRASLRHVPLIL